VKIPEVTVSLVLLTELTPQPPVHVQLDNMKLVNIVKPVLTDVPPVLLVQMIVPPVLIPLEVQFQAVSVNQVISTLDPRPLV